MQDDDSTLEDSDLIDLCSLPCYVEIYRSNLCNKIEDPWAKELYGAKNFKQLNKLQQQAIYAKLNEKQVFAASMACINTEKYQAGRERRRQRRTEAYLKERRRKKLFYKMKALADKDSVLSNISISSASSLNQTVDTVIENITVTSSTNRSTPYSFLSTYSSEDESGDAGRFNYLSTENGTITGNSESESEAPLTFPIMTSPTIHEYAESEDFDVIPFPCDLVFGLSSSSSSQSQFESQTLPQSQRNYSEFVKENLVSSTQTTK